jgi:glycosyltransferase A (GT-A) superfamily protein (DUF2064 family)
LLDAGAASVAIIGSDVPEIDPAAVRRAFDLVEAQPNTLVLGPAADGGYYLIAARFVPDVFERIEWGASDVLDRTINAAAARSLPVQLITAMADIDRVSDLERAAAAPPPCCARTKAWMRANGLLPQDDSSV